MVTVMTTRQMDDRYGYDLERDWIDMRGWIHGDENDIAGAIV